MWETVMCESGHLESESDSHITGGKALQSKFCVCHQLHHVTDGVIAETALHLSRHQTSRAKLPHCCSFAAL